MICKVKRTVCFISFEAFPVLISSNKRNYGGAELQFSIISKKLLEKNYEVHFIVKDLGQPKNMVVDQMNIHSVNFKYLGGSKYTLLLDWFRMFRVLKNIDADYYLIKTPRHLLLLVGIFGKIFNKKIIFIGQIDYDANLKLLNKHDKWISILFYRVGLLMANYVIAQNSFQFRGFIYNFRRKTCKISNVISFPASQEVSPKKYILWVGNDLPKKHPEIFLELAENLPEYEFQMILSTRITEASNRIEMRAKKISNLNFIGYVPFNNIQQYFDSSVLFIGTSEMEGFPNTYLQAWQSKTPVVSLYIDPDNIIVNYNLGLISYTFENLCHDVKKLMIDKTLRNELANNSCKYVNNLHSSDFILNKYDNLFNILEY